MSTISAADSSAKTKLATPDQAIGNVVGAPKAILRLEGLAALAAATAAYVHLGGGWALFAGLFLIPDLSMLGYLRDRRIGATIYNLGHSYLAPGPLVAFGLLASQPLAVSIGLIWIAHIGFDRVVGYGLKYDTAFGHTHLGQAGKSKR